MRQVVLITVAWVVLNVGIFLLFKYLGDKYDKGE